MPVLTSTGTWQLTECIHCGELIAVKSNNGHDAIDKLKEHLKESKFCGKKQADIQASFLKDPAGVQTTGSPLKNNIVSLPDK